MHTAVTACRTSTSGGAKGSPRRLGNAEREARMQALLVAMLCASSASEARAKFREFARLHAQRPAAFVRRLERARGLAR